MRQLPSLNGLRAFEATARLGSFAAAGAELNVSPAALSRLVKLLEARVQVGLFVRGANSLTLTLAGQTLAKGLTAQFDALDLLMTQIRQVDQGRILTLGMGPTFAMRWLIPRLSGFQRLHPDIEIRLATATPGGPALLSDWTASIRPGSGNWPGLESHALFSAISYPVAAPTLAAKLERPDDLARIPLLRVAGAEQDWPDWLAQAGVAGIDPTHGPLFDTAALALQAALDGLGATMARAPFVVDDLAAGRLIRPFDISIKHDRAWYLIHRGKNGSMAPDSGILPMFLGWLKTLSDYPLEFGPRCL